MMQPRVPPAQWKTANVCPLGCMPSIVQSVTPGPAEPDKTIKSRCFHCLAYWVTDTTGKMVKLVGVLQAELCPDCRRPFNSAADWNPEKNLCKNPGHVASSLLKAEP